jgi:membrane protein
MEMGHQAKPSLWKLGGLTPFKLGRRVWNQIEEDELSVRSAALAYYFILAVFPAMVLVLAIFGYCASAGSALQTSLYGNLARMLPGSAFDLLHKTLDEIIKASGAGKAIFGTLGALWAASGGVTALMESLNVAYDVKEDRPWWKQKVVAVGLTLGLAVLVLAALGITLFGGKAADFAGSHFGMGAVPVMLWKVLQWPLVLAFMLGAFAVTYYFAPNLKHPEWHWITPGAILGLFGWLIASLGFKIYLHFFNSYSKTYGSLGAAMILLLWLYISGYVILLGGEMNAEIGRAVEGQGAEEQRRKSLEWKAA